MQGPSCVQRQEELEGAAETLQVAQGLQVLEGPGRAVGWQPIPPVSECFCSAKSRGPFPGFLATEEKTRLL